MPSTRVHINLPVADLDASVRFYETVFGVAPTKRKPDYANFRLDDPALHLALVLNPALKPESMHDAHGRHFGIELFADETLADWKTRVKATGILPSLEEEDVICCYAVADKFWLEDPDGNAWEFWVRHDDEGATLFSSNEADACCAPAPAAKAEQPEAAACCPATVKASGCC